MRRPVGVFPVYEDESGLIIDMDAQVAGPAEVGRFGDRFREGAGRGRSRVEDLVDRRQETLDERGRSGRAQIWDRAGQALDRAPQIVRQPTPSAAPAAPQQEASPMKRRFTDATTLSKTGTIGAGSTESLEFNLQDDFLFEDMITDGCSSSLRLVSVEVGRERPFYAPDGVPVDTYKSTAMSRVSNFMKGRDGRTNALVKVTFKNATGGDLTADVQFPGLYPPKSC